MKKNTKNQLWEHFQKLIPASKDVLVETDLQTAIQQDPELKTLTFHQKDLPMVSKYLKLKAQTKSAYEIKLKTTPYVHLVYQETLASQALRFQNHLREIHHIFHQTFQVETLEKVNVQTFRTKIKGQREILKSHFQTFQIYQTKPSLYLQGDFSTGKTYFLKLMMQTFYQQCQPFLFLFMPELPSQFKTHWHDEHLGKKMEILKTIPYLFLDDLGAENLTPYLRDDIFLPFLHYRQEQGLPTFISSVLTIPQLLEHLSIKEEKSQRIKALRIINKLKQMCQFYSFDLKPSPTPPLTSPMEKERL
ncbi:hypothetical protein [Candidatus Phytoplasma phoenicium]|uniref:DNA replication protein DnaI n=1 Tax=Candidatus Phytoplasma phoenicium TaxID=198422 RepID=A0A0L0MK24_9MOLU|nr:hypothetical protein [Candidatus Phytoplasma phoenicium]KND62733.1 DNA replication protein DnaI [Candidatus Phytoplasma phoenicium]